NITDFTSNSSNMDEVMKKKLQKLDESLRHPAGSSAVDSLCEETAALSTSRKKKKKKKKKIQQNLGSQVSEQQDKEEPYPDTVVTSIEESNSSVQPFTHPDENSREWRQISRRWRSKLEKLANIDINNTNRLGNLTLVLTDEFRIAKGSDGTEVFLGLRDDGTEVAVKRMIKSNYQVLRNEEKFLRLFDSPSIVRYVDFAKDKDFGYLVLQLCEYTLEEYIQDHLPDDSAERSLVLKKLVKEVLCSLQVLHDQQTKVLHRDIKPQNVLIGRNIKGQARLADFGISRRLKQGETTLRTSIAGTRCWKAKENIHEKFNTGYKRSSDIQVGFQYLSVNSKFWMINENPNERPTVEQTLAHPFFWTDDRYNVILMTFDR
uniref:Protein kinase domain-containing protein n=1 Tax=Sinocyclocheilus grahami TaxID=75366 RepID=A0A672NI16_SINGR